MFFVTDKNVDYLSGALASSTTKKPQDSQLKSTGLNQKQKIRGKR